MTSSAAVLTAQRRQTKAFINDDPTVVALIPQIKVISMTGAATYSDGAPRTPQTFKLSLLAYDQRPTVTLAGVERVIDYHLIGLYDAVMEVGDYWVDGGGTRYEIIGFSEGWEYERKAFVLRHVPRGADL